MEKEEILQQDINAKKSAEVIAQDRQERDAMIKPAKDFSLDAAHKSAEAAAIVANAHIINRSQISGSDLFDLPHDEAEVAGYSGSSSSACGSPRSVTENPNDMFSGSGGSSRRATVFAVGQLVGTEHWMEWKTRTM